MSLKGKTLFITGASRGIGLAIALRAARDGANVAIAAKTADPHPKLPGTIYTAADEIESAGGRCLPLAVDIREEAQVVDAARQTAEKFGGIDIVINNASAISLTSTEATPIRRFDLMFGVNVRGTFLVTQACLPYLKRSGERKRNPHVLTLSPPLNLEPRWLGAHVGYMLAKYAMTLATLGFAEEFRADGVAANTLWPRTTIATAAVQNLLGGDRLMAASRTPEIYADAAHLVLTTPSRERTGQSLLVEDVLAEVGITDLSRYAAVPGTPDEALFPDVFL